MSLPSPLAAVVESILVTASSRGLCFENGLRDYIASLCNHSVPSAVVTFETALVLDHISSMYCRQLFNNPLSTPMMASAIADSL